AFSHVSRLLSQCQFDALEGLLIGKLEEKCTSLPSNYKKALSADPDEIMYTTPGDVGIFYDDNGSESSVRTETMKAAAVAFYGAALGLLAVGLRELLTGFEENRCSMTYMFEYPEYRVSPSAGLSSSMKLQRWSSQRFTAATGFSRSLGSVALRKAENMDGGMHLNVFTVDFNEELVALYGGSLVRQTHFLHECIKAILRLYKVSANQFVAQQHLKMPPQSVALVGHSMGGVVARALFTLPRFNPHLVSLIITQASPHMAPVLALDPYLLDFYDAVRQKWVYQANKLRNVTVLSVGGGYRDYQVYQAFRINVVNRLPSVYRIRVS
ncbi:hypothetical protein XENOCAPTIV_028029, partial [Xenoophorus captivus]